MFKGSCAALVTPMRNTGEIDEVALGKLIEWHIQEGTAALVVVGTTGESATLNMQEQARIIELASQIVKKRVPIIAGCGTNATQTTIANAKNAKEKGADGALVVTPYYNRPTQKGLIAHYTVLAKEVDMPFLLYNVPTRTGCDLLPETVAQLSKLPSIIGIKEATGNIERLRELKASCRSDFLFYSGDDATALDFILAGGHGVISITANVVPRWMQKLCQYALTDQQDKATELNKKLHLLHEALVIEPNPIPVKWVLYYLGKINEVLRLPLTALSEVHYPKLKKALEEIGA